MHDGLLTVAAWWAGTALAGGGVLLLGWILMRWTREPAARQRVGELAVVAALLVAAIRIGPAWLAIPWPGQAAAHAADVRAAARLAADADDWIVLAPRLELADTPARMGDNPAAAPSTASPRWNWSFAGAVAAGVYLVVAGALVARWLLGQWALVRLRRLARPASARARALFAAMVGRRFRPQPRLGTSDRVRLPIAFGLRRPAVLLPDSFDVQADDTTLRWVFAHELTHLRRRDPWSSWAVGLAQAVYFYLPWFWSIKRQIRLCQEFVADAAAAREGAAADEYAQFLVNLAKCPATPLGAAGLGSPSDLFRRVDMLLQLTSRKPAAATRPAFLSIVGLLTAAALASGVGVDAATPAFDNDSPVILIPAGDGERIAVDADASALSFVVVDDDEPDVKKEKKKEEKKSDKKRAAVVQDDGKLVITIPAGTDPDEAKKIMEKALAEARKQKDAARGAADEARKAADKARKLADSIRAEAQAQAKDVAAARIAPMVVRGEGRLGVRVEKPSAAMADQLDLPKGRGLVVVEVSDGSPAKKSGIRANDVILEFRGNAVPSDVGEFTKQLRDIKPDDEVDVVVLRKGRKETIRGIKLPEAKKGAVRLVAPKAGDGGEVEVQFDAIPKIDGKNLKFDIQFDAIPGVDAKKLENLKRDLKLKLERIDPEKLKDFHKELELQIAPLMTKIEELKSDEKKLQDLQRKLELEIVPMRDKIQAEKLDELKKRVRILRDGEELRSDHPARKQANVTVNVTIKDGELKAVQKEEGLEITVTGEAAGEKVNVREIKIDADGEKNTYRSVEDVPSKYRGKVERLIANRDDSPVRFRFEKNEQ